MNKRAFLTSIFGLVGSAAFTSLNLESTKANVLPTPSDSGETGRSGALLAQDDEDRRRRQDHDHDHDDEEERRRRHEEERRRRREEYERCRREYGEEVCRLRFGSPD
ncbi:MAG: hypothetical protein ABR878_04065 [Roseiarcus sp.]|jgi:hypothetical protein